MGESMTTATLPYLPGYTLYSDGRVQRPSGKFINVQAVYGGPPGCGGLYMAFKGPERKQYYVHVVICEAFHGTKPGWAECVRHYPDRNTSNNAKENLKWGTLKENQKDRLFHGTDDCGEKSAKAKFTNEEVRAIRQRKANGERQCEIATSLGVSTATISLIVNNKVYVDI